MPPFLLNKANWIIIATILVMGYLIAFRWTSERQLRSKQEALITAIEDGSWRRCEKHISSDYADRWGWTREDLGKAIKDVRSQFMVLSLDFQAPTWDIAGDTATVRGRVKVSGTGIGIGNAIIREANRLEAPGIFTWKKESWLPWDWKLVRLDHADLDVPSSYEPGDLLRMRNNAF